MRWKKSSVLAVVMSASACGGDDGAEAPLPTTLGAATTWMYQIQGLNEDGAVAALAVTDYPLLVLEPGHNFSESPYDTEAMVATLRTTPQGGERLLLAYVDIGQAEDYRDYWDTSWVAPTTCANGDPEWLLAPDGDGWSGNYVVAYWDPAWKQQWLGDDGIVAELATMGFDGIYLDWVEAWDDYCVHTSAGADGIDVGEEMIAFVGQLGDAGRAVNPAFVVVPQNAPFLIDEDPETYASAIDALAVEDTWFHGIGDTAWDDPESGDQHDRHDGKWSTDNRLAQYEEYLTRGIPVFSVDYCVIESNAAMVYEAARDAGLRPLVTQAPLSQLTDTPPSDY